MFDESDEKPPILTDESSRLSKCDVELLLSASIITYAVGIEDKVNFDHKKEKTNKLWHDSAMTIEQKGYGIAHSVAPKAIAGSSDKPLSAVCLTPKDIDAPIVIAFKGTVPSLKHDLRADINLVVQGVANKVYRDAAYEYYEEVRKKYPDRQIVITGHSLGGNLAQYVAMKAYSTGVEKDRLEVRTFNSAPVKTKHDTALTQVERSEVEAHFIHYRAQNDLVSKNVQRGSKDGAEYGCYGQMITLHNPDPNRQKAHKLATLKECIPDILLKQTIGGTSTPADRRRLAQENLLGQFEILQYKTEKLIEKINALTPADKERMSEDPLQAMLSFLDNQRKLIHEAISDNDMHAAHAILIGCLVQISKVYKSDDINEILASAYVLNASNLSDFHGTSPFINERESVTFSMFERFIFLLDKTKSSILDAIKSIRNIVGGASKDTTISVDQGQVKSDMPSSSASNIPKVISLLQAIIQSGCDNDVVDCSVVTGKLLSAMKTVSEFHRTPDNEEEYKKQVDIFNQVVGELEMKREIEPALAQQLRVVSQRLQPEHKQEGQKTLEATDANRPSLSA